MSLTRAEWLAMWDDIKALERIVLHFSVSKKSPALRKVQAIKDKIQSVVGQLESDEFKVG